MSARSSFFEVCNISTYDAIFVLFLWPFGASWGPLWPLLEGSWPPSGASWVRLGGDLEAPTCPKESGQAWNNCASKAKQGHAFILILLTPSQDCSGKQNKIPMCVFAVLGPNPGPGRLPLDSDRRDIEFDRVFASVASVAVSFA